MRFIVIGAGDVGTNLAQKLYHEHDVALIDLSQRRLERAVNQFDIQTVIGNGYSPETLLQAGISTADYVIGVADVDEVNIAACLTAKLINPTAKRIARVRNTDLDHPETRGHLADYFDLLINPDKAGADYLLRLLQIPGAKEILEFADRRVRVLGLSVSAASPVLGKKLEELREYQKDFPILLVAIVRGSRLIIPRGKDTIQRGDIIYAISLPNHTKRIFKLAGKSLSEGRRAMIWGGSALGKILAQSLEELGTEVKLVISDQQHAEELAGLFRSVLVLQGEGTDTELLDEENIQDIDAFIAATADEEDNVLSALLAKRMGAKTSVALVNKGTYLSLVTAIGVDVVVSSRMAAASAIFNHIHSDSVVSEFSVYNRGAVFLEFVVNEGMGMCGTELRKLTLPSGVIFGAIIRHEEIVIPDGNSIVEDGDHLVIFVLRSAIKKLEKFLGVKLELFT